MTKKLVRTIAVPMVFLLVSLGNAQNPDWIHIHGLIGQGYLKTTDNNYFMNTKDGSLEFNEIAVNFTVRLTPKLRGGLQLFSRDFGPNGNNDIFLDWGYLDYLWRDYLGLRAGKIKRPAGFYNTVRDMDALRTFVLLPQGVYNESMRDFTMSAQGASVYGNISLGLAGDLEYEAYYGVSNMDPDLTFTKELFLNIADDMGKGISQQMAATGGMPPGSVLSPRVVDPVLEMEHSEAVSVIWNTPLDGLRLGATRMLGKTSQSATFDFRLLMGGTTLTQITVPFESSLKFNGLDTYSAEYIWKNLTLGGEYMVTDGEITTDGQVMGYRKEQAYYGQAAYRFTKWLEIGSYYSVTYPDSEDKEGDRFKATGRPDYLAWQKDMCLTLRFDLNERWLVKCETHFMDGAGQLSPTLNPDGFKQNWQLYTVKTSIIF
ncbi:hypothetical protein JW948_04495 [bacterium]|nr:hypothetical protein [bacterium]